jgi:hypothetical protein
VAGKRVDLGFEGGSVVRLTAEESTVTALVESLGNGTGWRSVEAEEGTYWVNVAELIYLRLVPGDAPPRIGFGGT